jgi:hypothetical protein
LALGLGSFFVLVYGITFWGAAASTLLGRNAKAAGLASIATLLFFLFLSYLLLNTLVP